jgi:hypothetical protein
MEDREGVTRSYDVDYDADEDDDEDDDTDDKSPATPGPTGTQAAK